MPTDESEWVYYLAGPMAGLPSHNYPAFEYNVWKLRGEGYRVVSPHEINSNMVNKTVEQRNAVKADCLRNDIRALLSCDGVFVMRGSENSRGVALELHIAEELGLSITYLGEGYR